MWTIPHTAAPPASGLRLALEPRLMLDADPAVALADAASADTASTPASQPSTDQSATRQEVVFVFSEVAELAGMAPAGAEVIRIDSAEDGLARMAAELQGRSGLDAIHVIGHGAAGSMDLGSAVLDIGQVSARAAELSDIGAALAADGDLLFYGCDIGAGEAGRALADALAEATGADLALSDDATGAADLGGDWELEVRAGAVETAAMAAPQWDSVLAALQTSLVSVATDGSADAASTNAVVSADGRYVAFTSSASDLVAGDTNGVADVFLRDTVLGTTTRISISTNSADRNPNGASQVTDISVDGRYVVFTSAASNLVSGDTNNQSDVFVFDTQGTVNNLSNATTRASLNRNGGQIMAAGSSNGSISSDGRYVAFLTSANLAAPAPPAPQIHDANNSPDVYVRDLTGGTTTGVSMTTTNQFAGGAGAPQISSDGQFVVFTSTASTLVAGDTNGVIDVFLRALATNTTTRIGANLAEGADSPSPSTDAAQVAFRTSASLVAGDTNGLADIYIYDRFANTFTLASGGGNGASGAPSLSGGGDFVAFESTSSNLVSGDTNGVTDVFLYDKAKNTISRVSVSSANVQADAASDTPFLGSDGGHVAFRTAATNLSATDANGLGDIYMNTGSVVTPASQGAVHHIPGSGQQATGPALNAAREASRQGAEGLALAPAPPGSDTHASQPAPPVPAPLPPTIGAVAVAPPPPPPPGPGPGPGGGIGGPFPGPGMPGFERLSLEERRALMHGMRMPALIQALQADAEPAAQTAAEIVQQVADGKEVTLSEAKEALEQQGASPEQVRAYLAAVQQAIKTQRTGQLAGALQELARDTGAANAFSAPDAGKGALNVELTGNRVAILIGVEKYNGVLPDLGTPTNDVAGLSSVLAERFGYQTIVAQDATKADVVDLIRGVGERLDANGSLVVYYAGHGYAVEATGEGYWLPADARADKADNWISTRDLSGYLGQVKANQIMVVSDSCYSGAMTREMRLTSDAVGLPREQLVQRRSVTSLSSGGEEPVADGGPGGHSVFAANFIKTLESANATDIGFDVFGKVRSEVARELPQVPTYGALTSAGHAGGTDFVIGGR